MKCRMGKNARSAREIYALLKIRREQVTHPGSPPESASSVLPLHWAHPKAVRISRSKKSTSSGKNAGWTVKKIQNAQNVLRRFMFLKTSSGDSQPAKPLYWNDGILEMRYVILFNIPAIKTKGDY